MWHRGVAAIFLPFRNTPWELLVPQCHWCSGEAGMLAVEAVAAPGQLHQSRYDRPPPPPLPGLDLFVGGQTGVDGGLAPSTAAPPSPSWLEMHDAKKFTRRYFVDVRMCLKLINSVFTNFCNCASTSTPTHFEIWVSIVFALPGHVATHNFWGKGILWGKELIWGTGAPQAPVLQPVCLPSRDFTTACMAGCWTCKSF